MAYFLESIKDRDVIFWHNVHSSLKFVLYLCYSLETLHFLLTFNRFLIITFDWNTNFALWWFHQKDIVQIYQNTSYFKLISFYVYKNQFFWWKMKNFRFFFCRFFKILPKFSEFVNSDDCIEKITSKSMRLQPVYIKRKFEVNKIQIFF